MGSDSYNIEDFKLGKQIGEGGFATVFRAECLRRKNVKDGEWSGRPGEYVAIKRIDRSRCTFNVKVRERLKEEISIHRRIKHENIVQFYTEFEDDKYKYLVLELCHCTLDDHIKQEGALAEFLAFQIIKQIVQGMVYLHRHLIIHRDLSLRNILLTEKREVKIADFGFATKLSRKNENKMSTLGTPNYQSPQIHKREPYGLETDSWSLGCIIFAILGGKLPFDAKHVEKVVSEALSKDIQNKIPEEFTPEAKELVIGLLTFDEKKRWKITDLPKSSFFIKYSKSDRSCSQTKNGSFGNADSGMGSMKNSCSASEYRNNCHSLKVSDSGLDSLNSSLNEVPRSNYNTHLDTIHSSGISYQSSNSRSIHKNDSKRDLKPSLRVFDQNGSERSKERFEKCGSLVMLKNTIPALPSRRNRLHIVSRNEATDAFRYPALKTMPEERSWSETNNEQYSVPRTTSPVIPFPSDKRERSVSEERRKQERQRAPFQPEKLYSYEGDYASLQNKCTSKKSWHKSTERSSPHKDISHSSGYSQHCRNNISSEKGNIDQGILKRSRSMSSERRFQHSSPHKDRSHSSGYSQHSRSNISSEKCCKESCKFEHSLFDDKYDYQSSSLFISSQKHIPQEKKNRHQENLHIDSIHNSNNDVSYQLKNNLRSEKIQPTSNIQEEIINTERLLPDRSTRKKVCVVSILENGEVCVEWLKTKEEKQYVSNVLMISKNSEWMYAFKPHKCLVGDAPPPMPNDRSEIMHFTFKDLPKLYRKMYRKAQAIIEKHRARTVKITYNKDNAKCVMMENGPNPDFEMEFSDGGRITQKSNKWTITDKKGKSIDFTEVHDLDTHFAVMWEQFIEMKEFCISIEREQEEKKLKGLIPIPYPILCGNPPLEKKTKSTEDNYKENISQPSPGPSMINESTSKTKSYKDTKGSLDIPKLSNLQAILDKLKSKPKWKNGKIWIEYKDGYKVSCSADGEEIKIYDFRNNCIYSSQIEHSFHSELTKINMIRQELPCILPVAKYIAIEGAVT